MLDLIAHNAARWNVVSARIDAGTRERRLVSGHAHLWLILDGAARVRFGADGQLLLRSEARMGAIAQRFERKHATGLEISPRCELVESLCQALAAHTDHERASAPGRDHAHRDLIWRRLWRARIFGEANAHRRVCLRELAQQAFSSPWHFQRQFQAVFGEPPGEWLDRLRFRRALELVQKTHLPVKKVASASGYDDAAVFSRWFRNHAGVSAARLRRHEAAA
jgi:AraC-like DNA-binding protein